MRVSGGVVALGCLLAATGPACRKDGDQKARATLTPCRVPGVSGEVGCLDYEVYEDRVARTGRKIKLHVRVVRALAPDPRPDPLFILAGGPGQAATELAKRLLPALERVRRHRDLVFVDQRGTGQSSPLECALEAPDAGVAEELSDQFPLEVIKGCLAGYQADPRLYTTAIAMDDLDEVRGALGYERVNLWGGSYGTRAALVYLRQHPDRVRAVILDGVAPVDMGLPLAIARDGQRALELLFEHCEKDPACQAAFPDLRRRFATLLAELERAPAQVQVPNPLTGVPEPARITRAIFAGTVRGLLYLPETTSLLPLTIDRASRGDYAPFVAQAALLSGGFEKGLSIGMFFSVVCAEDAPLVEEDAIAPATAGTFVGEHVTRQLMQACAVWPRGWIPEGYHAPVTSEVPTLVLSGELDPVTPPSRGEAAAKGLSKSLHLVVPGVGHGVTTQGCVPAVIADFLARGTTDGLDVSCAKALRRPPFFVTFAGPTR